MEDKNKMIMDDVVETKVSDQDMANIVSNGYVSQQINQQQLNRFRKTRTFIRTHNKKIGRNDLCPCGSGKKFKNCCIDSLEYNQTRELTSKEMYELKIGAKNIDDFKETLK